MRIKLTKKEKQLGLIAGLIIFAMPLILTRDIGGVSFIGKGEIGDTIGGITAPFLSFFGSILVYLALRAQIDANDQIKDQFVAQNQSHIFFKLIDNINNRIDSISFESYDSYKAVEVKGHGAVTSIANKFGLEMGWKCSDYGRQLLSKKPEIIELEYYQRIINSSNEFSELSLKKAEELKLTIIELENPEKRWEYLKHILSSQDDANNKQYKAIEDIGSVYFYKTPYEDRYALYNSVYEENYKEYGSFFSGYFGDVEYLLKFIDKIENNEFYVDFLINNFTRYQKAILFYYLASDRSSKIFKQLIKKHKLINSLIHQGDLFVDLPSEQELEKELYSIFNFKIS